ncbi:MAG: translesion error-prone DNA polymerase V autoproteolytic subunit [Bacteroidetes bacterium]|nr:translesion error-prone DNA polymerase V autoproteolytic subunit [Bacteroidota bacterium]
MSALRFYSGPTLELFSAATEVELALPFLSAEISAGFPSPALDFVECTIDLNKHLVKHPATTFYGRVKGESMRDAGINDGDLLVIDRSLEPRNGKIAVCYIDGEFTLKRIKISKGVVWLMPANPEYEPIKVDEGNELLIWGIVTHVIKTL